MTLSRMFRNAGVAAFGVVMLAGVGTVAAKAMPVQQPTAAVAATETPVQQIQYRDWDRERAFRHRQREWRRDRMERRWDRERDRRHWEYRQRRSYY